MTMKNISFARNLSIAFVIIIAGLLLRGIYAGIKTNFHIDEGYSVALTNGNWEPRTDDVVRDQWITEKQIEGVSFTNTIEKTGKADFDGMAHATGLDVHPPLYYWIFAVVRVLFGAENFALAGYALNMVLYVITCVLLSCLVWRTWKDWYMVFFTLACFVFSSTSLSLTIFIRMYELLQMLCLAFLFCAFLVLFSNNSESGSGRATVLGIAGLFVTSYLGLMTQYYFLLFIAPVAAFALIYLLIRKRLDILLWCVLAVAVGLYLAFLSFPQMADHITGSYRAGQSINNLFKATMTRQLANFWAYVKILSENLVPPVVLLAVAILAIIEKVRKGKKAECAQADPDFRAPFALPACILLFLIFAFTFVVISVSAPYQTARYIASFFPVYAMLFTGFTYLVLSRKNARIMLGAAALLVMVHGVIPSNVCEFHEDYPLDAAAGYMHDDKPVIIMSTPDGGSWKNMLLYMNLGKSKRVFVASEPAFGDITQRLAHIAAGSGSSEAYAIVDNYYQVSPSLEKIGYYGFFNVYRIKVQ